MPLVRRIRKRGANIVVEAYGEVLFAASGDIGRWTNRFSQRVRSFAAQEAPTNKRPRWGHYGKPLKTTFTASTTYQPMRMRVYSAIGSSAPHAYYVDQGTGVFNGSGPYPAKVLPPWQRGEGSLYEATWRPAGPGTRKVNPVMIKGQKGQFFFDKGLARGFRSMRLRSFQLPGEGGPKISEAINSIPSGMTNFAGNTPADGAFIASLEQWRAWRDAAWTRGKLGRNIRPERNPKPTKPKAVKPTKPTKPTKVKPPKPTKPTKAEPPTLRDKQDKAVAAFRKQNPNIRIKARVPSGLVVSVPGKGDFVIPWSRLYNLL